MCTYLRFKLYSILYSSICVFEPFPPNVVTQYSELLMVIWHFSSPAQPSPAQPSPAKHRPAAVTNPLFTSLHPRPQLHRSMVTTHCHARQGLQARYIIYPVFYFSENYKIDMHANYTMSIETKV